MSSSSYSSAMLSHCNGNRGGQTTLTAPTQPTRRQPPLPQPQEEPKEAAGGGWWDQLHPYKGRSCQARGPMA